MYSIFLNINVYVQKFPFDLVFLRFRLRNEHGMNKGIKKIVNRTSSISIWFDFEVKYFTTHRNDEFKYNLLGVPFIRPDHLCITYKFQFHFENVRIISVSFSQCLCARELYLLHFTCVIALIGCCFFFIVVARRVYINSFSSHSNSLECNRIRIFGQCSLI